MVGRRGNGSGAERGSVVRTLIYPSSDHHPPISVRTVASLFEEEAGCSDSVWEPTGFAVVLPLPLVPPPPPLAPPPDLNKDDHDEITAHCSGGEPVDSFAIAVVVVVVVDVVVAVIAAAAAAAAAVIAAACVDVSPVDGEAVRWMVSSAIDVSE